VLRTRQLKPVGRVANAWLYSEETVVQVGEALARIAERRGRNAPFAAPAELAAV